MEVRKPSKSTYMHQSCSRYKPYDVIQVKEKSQLSLPKKLNFFFPHAEFVLFCFQNRLSWKRGVLKTDIVETKKKLLKIVV